MKHPRLVGIGAAIILLLIWMVPLGGFQTIARSTKVKVLSDKIEVAILGKDAHLNRKLPRPSGGTGNPADSSRTIQTAVLPLRIEYLELAKDNSFAETGGGLTIVDGELFILDRAGRIYRLAQQKLIPANLPPIPNGIADFVADHPGEELGSNSMRAHSMAYDVRSGKLFVSYTKYERNAMNRLAVSSLNLRSDRRNAKVEWQTVYETPGVATGDSQAGGGKLLCVGNKLYLAVGYSEEVVKQDTLYANAQDPAVPFGKIIEIDPESRVVRTITIGHRNVQGMTTLANGQILATEHGPQGGDKINIVKDGQNFGWPWETYGTRYGTYDYDWPATIAKPKLSLAEPLFAFVPSIAPSSIIEVSGFHSRWDGDLLIGALKAQSIFRLKYKNGRVLFSEPIWLGRRVRDLVMLRDKIVALTDDSRLLFMSVDEDALHVNKKENGIAALDPRLARCITCHHFEQTTPLHTAPSLAGIVGRRIASDSFQRYSPGLQRKGGNWDKDSLMEFLRDPQAVAPGTIMPNLGLTPTEAQGIVEALGG